MKTKLTALFSLIAIAITLSLTSCKSTGDIGADTQGFWNSAAVQTELTAIQSEAITFLNNYLAGQMGASKSRSLAASPTSAAQRATVAHLKAKFPNVPDTVLEGAAAKAAKQ